MPDIVWAGSPNYREGRNGRKPIAIVNHITSGKYPGCLTWMQNPAAKASAHYLVTKTGKIYQLVKDENTAWHAGQVSKPAWPLYDGTNPNQYTIGIEHEALAGEGLTEEQFNATAWLQKQLVVKWGIPVDADHIIGHYRIDSVNRPNCPGSKFPWESLFKILKGNVSSIPTGSNITPFKSGNGWLEDLPERTIAHQDAYNYVCFWKDGRVTEHHKDKETIEWK